MASTRELWVLLRARDEASRVVHTFSKNVRAAALSAQAAQKSAQAAAIRQQAQMLKSNGATAQNIRSINDQVIQLEKQARANTRAAAKAREYRAEQMKSIDSAVRSNNVHASSLERQAKAYTLMAAIGEEQRNNIIRVTGATDEQTAKLDNNIATLRKRAATLNAEAAVSRSASASMIAQLQKEQTGLDGSIRSYERRAASIRAQAAILRNAAQEQGVNLNNEIRKLTDQAAALDRQANSFRQAANAAREHDNRMKAIIGSMGKVSEAATVMAFSLAAVGAGGMVGLKSSIDTAVAYERQVRLTATQVSNFSGNLKELGDIGKRVANDIAIPFEGVQTALFDIFSSIDVSVKDSEKYLRAFAKAAVAGQTDIQSVSRGTIGIMNAFGLSTKDLNKVLDIQFKLVQKGIGTYDEWVNRFGKVSPSAQRAGQSIEMMAAALASATRFGVPAAQAATSVARVFDAFSNPKAVTALKKLGVSAVDAKGNFKEFNVVMNDFRAALAKVPGGESGKIAAILEVFKGAGGTIEARKFLNTLLLSSNGMKTFNAMLKETSNSTGSMANAYNIMAGSTANKSELLRNKWMLLKTAIGDALIPQFNKLLDTISKALDWFNKLPQSTQKAIGQFLMWGSIISIVLAGMFGLIAIVAVFVAAVATIGGAAAIAVGAIALIPVALVAMGAAFIYAYKHSETFRNTVKQVGDNLKQLWDVAVSTASGIKSSFEANVLPPLKRLADVVTTKLLPAFREFQATFENVVIPKVKEAGRIIKDIADTAFKSIGDSINNVVIPAVTKMSEWWAKNGDTLRPLMGILGQVIKWLLILTAIIIGVLVAAFVGPLVAAIAIAVGAFQLLAMGAAAVINFIKGIPGFFSSVGSAIAGFAGQVGSFFSSLWSTITSVFGNIVQWFTELPGRILGFLQSLPSMLANLFVSALNGAAYAVGYGIGLIYIFFTQIVPNVLSFLGSLPARLGGLFLQALALAGHAVASGVSAVLAWFAALPVRAANAVARLWAAIRGHFENARTGAATAGRNLITGFMNIINTFPSRVATAIYRVYTAILHAFDGSITWLTGAGRDIIMGVINGIRDAVGGAVDILRNAGHQMVKGFKDAIKSSSPSKVFMDIGYNIIRGLIIGITGTRKQLLNAMDKIAHDVMSSLNAGKASKGVKISWARYLHSVSSKLLTLEAKRASVNTRLAAAQKSVNDQLKDRADLMTKIQDKLSEGADIMQFKDSRSASSIKTGLSRQLDAAQQFSKNIMALQAKGLNKDTISELAQAGVAEAGGMAKALANASDADIAEINKLQANIRALAKNTGTSVAGQMYDAGIQAAQGLVKGLQSQSAAITKVMTQIANALIAQIKKTLGIKSPSKVFEGIGINTALGYIQGYKKQMMNSSLHTEMLAASPRPGMNMSGNPSAMNNTGRTFHQVINVYTQEIDPRKNAAELGWELEGRLR